LINSTSDFRIDAMPFGGFKRSGIGREGVESSILSLSEPKVVAIRSRRAGSRPVPSQPTKEQNDE
jgi:acyl-CoA reductase-like NAD-dependent aldehyde dehydrogenase